MQISKFIKGKLYNFFTKLYICIPQNFKTGSKNR